MLCSRVIQHAKSESLVRFTLCQELVILLCYSHYLFISATVASNRLCVLWSYFLPAMLTMRRWMMWVLLHLSLSPDVCMWPPRHLYRLQWCQILVDGPFGIEQMGRLVLILIRWVSFPMHLVLPAMINDHVDFKHVLFKVGEEVRHEFQLVRTYKDWGEHRGWTRVIAPVQWRVTSSEWFDGVIRMYAWWRIDVELRDSTTLIGITVN